MKFKIIAKLKLGLLSALLLMLASCNGGNSSSGNAVASDGAAVASSNTTKSIYFDSVGQIPLEGGGQPFSVRIHNSFENQFTLKSLQVIDPLSEVANPKLASLNTAMCSTIPAHNSCAITITPHLNDSGSFMLEAELLDSFGKVTKLTQMIRVSSKINGTQGIIFKNDLETVTSVDGSYHLALPVVLGAKFDQLKVSNGTISCSNGYNPGSSCSYFVDVSGVTENTLIETKVEGYNQQSLTASVGYAVVTVASRANLLLSQPTDIKISETETESTTSVSVYNNGTVDAVGLSFSSGDPKLSVIRQSCSSVVRRSSRCNFTLRAQSVINGSGAITANYKSQGATTALSTISNIVYLKNGDGARLSVLNNGGSLLNGYVGVSTSENILLANTGTRDLTNIVYNLSNVAGLSVAPAAAGSTVPACKNSGLVNLAVGEKCGLRVSYIPPSATTGAQSYMLSTRASYKNSSNHSAYAKLL
jgi:hypothetical protein